MSPEYTQYIVGCQTIWLLTNLHVHLFDTEGVLQLSYASYDLPVVIEQYKQATLVQILQQPLVKEQVYVFHNSIGLEFLATGIWDGTDYRGTLVVGPFISKAFSPELLREMSQNERVPLTMQKQLQQGYNTLPMVGEAKQQAIAHVLINLCMLGMIQPQRTEISLPSEDGATAKFKYKLEQNRELVERRYEVENKILHAIARGDPQLLKKVTQEV